MTLPMTYEKKYPFFSCLCFCIFFFFCFAVDVFVYASAHENNSRHQKSELIKQGIHARRCNNKIWAKFLKDHIERTTNTHTHTLCMCLSELYVPTADDWQCVHKWKESTSFSGASISYVFVHSAVIFRAIQNTLRSHMNFLFFHSCHFLFFVGFIWSGSWE